MAFERGVVIFGEDSKPKCKALPFPLTKLHQMCYIEQAGTGKSLLAVSTEDGRILFYAMDMSDSTKQNGDKINTDSLPDGQLIAQLGGREQGVTNRIKDFEIVVIPSEEKQSASFAVVTASSDGTIRVWHIEASALGEDRHDALKSPVQVGKLIGTYETGSRITCLKAFLMQAPRTDEGLSEFEGLTEEGEDLSSNSDSDV